MLAVLFPRPPGPAARESMGRRRRHLRRGIRVPHHRVMAHIHQKGFPEVLQSHAKGEVGPVDFVTADPPVGAAALPRGHHHFQRQFCFGAVRPARLRNFGPGATGLIPGPGLRQKKPEVQRRGMPPAPQAREDAHLAVFGLAQPPALLALHPHRPLALFHETGLIQIQGTVGMAAQKAVRFARRLNHQRLMASRRMADELLHALVVAFGHIRLNALDVLTPLPSQESGEVVPRVPTDILAAHGEMMAVVAAQAHERGRGSPQNREVIFVLRRIIHWGRMRLELTARLSKTAENQHLFVTK